MTSAKIRWLLFAVCLALACAAYEIRHARRAESGASGNQFGNRADAMTPGDATAARARAPARLVAPFTLIDQDGKPFATASLAGRVWVASFFFSGCPAICIRLNQAISGYLASHPDSEAHFVSISCDPENDTPELLSRYARRYQADPARWTFLTGDMETIKKIGYSQFQVAVNKENHSDRTFAVDRTGHIRGYYRITEPDEREKLERLLRTLEAEPAPAVEQGAAAPAAEQGGAVEALRRPGADESGAPVEGPRP